MLTKQKLMNEIRALGLAMLYFSIWFGFLILIKMLVLAEYALHFGHLGMALIGALVLAKVVLILERVPLGSRVRHAPVWIDVLLRTLLYTFGVFLVMILEKALEKMHGHGSFAEALSAVFGGVDINHVLANTLCVAGALFTYNVFMVVREAVGPGGLKRLLMTPRREIPRMKDCESTSTQGLGNQEENRK